jgi:hypothetical protein
MGSTYHPQSDDQTERVNQCLETYLRCFVHACPHKWNLWLSLAEFWYNTSFHSALRRSPFEVLYGRPPRHFGLAAEDSATDVDLATWLSNRELMTKVVRQHLHRAQSRMKSKADKARLEREFAVGERVYLKLQPYIQTSVAPWANHKLSFKYFGPFTVLQRVGSVAYKLELPAESSVHTVFHVSLVKKAVSPIHQISSTLPDSSTTTQIPVQVLDTRTISRGGTSIPQVRVRWSGCDDALATWEDLDTIRQQYPDPQQHRKREGMSAMLYRWVTTQPLTRVRCLLRVWWAVE